MRMKLNLTIMLQKAPNTPRKVINNVVENNYNVVECKF